MSITTTGRRHIINAVRKAALLNARQAAEIVYMDINERALALRDLPQLHKVEAVVCANPDNSGSIALYIPNADGGSDWVASLRVYAPGLKRWNTASIARAYGLDEDLVSFYENEAGLGDRAATAAFNMDDTYEPFIVDNAWHDGIILTASDNGNHVAVDVALQGMDEIRAMVMLPCPWHREGDLIAYVKDHVGETARLNIGSLSSFTDRLPAGLNAGTKVIEMIMPKDFCLAA